jgi:hypothetical protein
MGDLAGYLPQWIVAAAAPAAAVIAFFWKGDDALSPEFRQWLGEKLCAARPASGFSQQAELTSSGVDRRRSALDALLAVFDLVFGFGGTWLPSFFRVGVISTIAAFVVVLGWPSNWDSLTLTLTFLFGGNFAAVIVLVIVNMIFGYISVAKSMFILRRVRNAKYGTALFFVFDLVATLVVLVAYAIVFESRDVLFPASDSIGIYGTIGLGAAFFGTTFLTFLLALAYVVAAFLLNLLATERSHPVGVAGAPLKAWSTVTWILPVKTLPIRSTGIMAGAVVFCGSLITKLLL